MGTLLEFIVKHNLRMNDPDYRDSNPNMADDKWAREATHWTCVLRRGGRQMTVPFSQGAAHVGPPELKSVLDCLASDASGVANAQSFEDWCSEYGYDTDSRKAEGVYKACVQSAKKLKNLLGEEAYEELLWNTERL